MKANVKTNFLYSMMYNFFSIIVPLITTPFVSRRLGATGVGDYAFAYSVAYYYTLFIKLGLNNYGNRMVAYYRDDTEKLSGTFWNIYCFQFLLAVIVTGIYVFYCLFIAEDTPISLLLVMFVISAGIDITWFYWGMEEFKTTVARDFIVKVFSTVCIFAFIRTEADTWKYTLILSACYLISQVMLWPSLKKYVRFVRPTFPEVVRHIKPNLLLFMPAVAVSIYKIMDKIMLGMISTTREVGLYESSEKILRVPLSIIEALGAVMQPRMSNLVSNRAEERYMSDLMKKSILLMMFASTSIGFGIMAISPQFVPQFYGAGFEKCSILFRILLPSCMFLAFTNVFKSQYLLPRRKDKEYTMALFTGASINFLTNLLLIPSLASIGAAIGTLFAEASVCVVIALVVNRELRFGQYLVLSVPFLLSGLAMFIVGELLEFPGIGALAALALKILICGSVYLAVLAAALFADDTLCGRRTTRLIAESLQGIFRKKS